MARLFEAVPSNDLPNVPNHNVCPTNPVHVVASGENRRLSAMRWGFLPHWYKTSSDGPLLINARSETVADKPAFRAAARSRRCLIPSAGFYEWRRYEDGTKQPYLITRADDSLLVMAGIWQRWERDGETLTTCAIVTTEATGEMRRIHNRVPVIVEPEDWSLWLGEAGTGAARLMQSPQDGALVFTERAPG